MSVSPVRRLRRVEASRYLLEIHGVSRAPATLAKLACVGGGPPFVKMNHAPLYAPADLDAWVASRTTELQANTSAAA